MIDIFGNDILLEGGIFGLDFEYILNWNYRKIDGALYEW